MTDTSHSPELIGRRAALERVAALLGGSLVGGSALWSGCRPGPRKAANQGLDVTLLDEVAETILPATRTLGAKAAKVGAFIASMVADCYDEREQRIFAEGLRQIEERCRAGYRTSFITASNEQQTSLLRVLDQEAYDHGLRQAPDEPAHYFRMIKELTLLGYFTSELGATDALRWVPVPGRYEPCIEWHPNERNWASPA